MSLPDKKKAKMDSALKNCDLSDQATAEKKFLLLHKGFRKPSKEDMEKWKGWFEKIEPVQVDQGGFKGGVEIDSAGSTPLVWGLESFTGFNIIMADSLAAAEALAKEVPFISSVQVYELR
eukprot:m.49014 g.49014  ORF g.49014 m.49014 type:complete len:120 (+) comp15288_c0_seq1:393-752(+)